jgi:hypothetical protein
MDQVKPEQLRGIARGVDALVYVAGAIGIVAGGLLYNTGSLPPALLSWAGSFVACTVLLVSAWLLRGLAQLLERASRVERTVDALYDAQAAPRLEREERERGAGRDPWRSWPGGLH